MQFNSVKLKEPEILSVPISGETVQTCLDTYFLNENLDKKCPNCQSTKSLKTADIAVPPSTLILQLKWFSYDETNDCVTKLHVPVHCPLNVSLQGRYMYYLNSVINHSGESATSGHYTILLNDRTTSNPILVDDDHISHNIDVNEIDDVSYVAIYSKL